MGKSAVIIPVYNGEQFLARALDSVLGQSRRPERIVVVDDASTDRSVAVARGYISRGHAVEVLTSDVNRGPGAARNRGIRHVSAELVFFLDADDWWLPHHCDSVGSALLAHQGAGFAHAFAMGAPSRAPENVLVRMQVYDSVWPLLFDSRIPQSAVVARRETILAVGGYDEAGRYAEDYDLWLRAAIVAPYVEVRDATYGRGSHPGQASRRQAEMYRGAWAARQRLRDFAKERGIALDPDRWKQVLRQAFEHDLRSAWQSRSRPVLTAVLNLHKLVPDGNDLHRKWHLRTQLIWPAWRLSAWGWDVLPDRAQRRVRKMTGR